MKIKRLCLIALISALLLGLLTACNGSVTEDPPKATSYIRIDVNPSVELVLDQRGNVMSAAGLNSDGNVLIYNESGIVGSSVNVAIGNLVGLMSSYGYLVDGGDVYLSVYSSDDDLYDAVRSDITAIGNYSVKEDVELSDVLELEKAGSEMSPARYGMLKRAASLSDRSISELSTLSDEEVLGVINTASSNSDSKLGMLYDRTVAEARHVLESARQVAKDELYSIYFTGKTLSSATLFSAVSNAKRAFYANVYAALHNAEFNLSHYYNSLKEYIANPIITLEDVKAVFQKIGGFFKDLTEDIFADNAADDEGNVTRESLTAYVDSLYRSLPEDKREEFKAQYVTISSEVTDKVSFEGFDYASVKQQLNGVFDDIDARLTEMNDDLGISDRLEGLKNEVKAVFDKVVDFFKDAITRLGLDQIDFKQIFSVQNMIDRLHEAAQYAYDEMELTDEDIATVTSMEEDIAQTLDDAKAAFEDAIAAAKQNAHDWLSAAKEALRSHD